MGKNIFSELRKVSGPAWLVMMANFEAASIITAIELGASFKYEFIIVLAILTIPLYFICEVAGRVGSVTRKGLGELIRDNFSKKISVVLSFPMAISDFLSYVAEYTGIAIGAVIIGISPFIVLPIVYAIHIILVYKKEYKYVEKVLMLLSLVMVFTYLALTYRGFSNYSLIPSSITSNFLYLLAATVGATIMPFMLFYQVTATAKKEFHSVTATKVETLVGAIFSEILMIAVILVSSKLSPNLNFLTSQDIAKAIMAIGGSYAPIVFAIGLACAGFLALVVISMASAWGITESLGIGKSNWFKIYVVESLPALLIPLFFTNLIFLILNLMVAFVFVLIGPVIVLGLLAQNRRLMGINTLKGFERIAFWSSVLAVIVCGLLAFV